VPDVVAGTQYQGSSGGRVYAFEGNDATPIRTPAVIGRAVRNGIELTWEADLTAPGTVFNLYRRLPSPAELDGVAGAAVREQRQQAIATADLPTQEKIELLLQLADDPFERVNDRPITPRSGVGRFVDTAVIPGRVYEYRLGYREPGAPAERLLPEVSVQAPTVVTAMLAIRPVGPVGGARGWRISWPPGVAGDYRVTLYGVDGRLVREIATGHLDPADPDLELAWDGRDARGGPLATGVYIAEVRLGGSRATTKFVWLR
jgi:hypothetical protein